LVLQGLERCRGLDVALDDNVLQLFQLLKSFIESSFRHF
jgi:hypothetical protein